MVQLKQQFQGYESVENSNKDKKPCFEVEAVEVEGARFIQDESRLRHLIITYKPANFDAGTFMNWWNRRLVKEAHDGPFHMVALDVLFYNGEELHAFAVQLEMESYAPQVINVFNRLGDEGKKPFGTLTYTEIPQKGEGHIEITPARSSTLPRVEFVPQGKKQ